MFVAPSEYSVHRRMLPSSEVTRPALLLGPGGLRVGQGVVCQLLLVGVDDLATAVLAL